MHGFNARQPRDTDNNLRNNDDDNGDPEDREDHFGIGLDEELLGEPVDEVGVSARFFGFS